MQLGYSEGAEARLDEIIAQLSVGNPPVAAAFLRNLERAQTRLAKFPRLGHRISEFPDSPYREFIIAPYRFFYFIDERRKMLWIVEIWHGAQRAAEPRAPVV